MEIEVLLNASKILRFALLEYFIEHELLIKMLCIFILVVILHPFYRAHVIKSLPAVYVN